MKKILLLSFSLFLMLNAFAQDVWKKTIVDDRLSVSIPAPVAKMDTTFQTIYYGMADPGTRVMVSKINDPHGLLYDTMVLRKFYQSYAQSMMEQAGKGSKILFTNQIQVAGLQAMDMGYNFYQGASYYCESVIVYTESCVYSFTAMGSTADKVKKAKAELMKTVQFNIKPGSKLQLR